MFIFAFFTELIYKYLPKHANREKSVYHCHICLTCFIKKALIKMRIQFVYIQI